MPSQAATHNESESPMRHFIRLPAYMASNPAQLIEFCSGCAKSLHDSGKAIVTDSTEETHLFGITIYDLRDPMTRAQIFEGTHGIHHYNRDRVGRDRVGPGHD